MIIKIRRFTENMEWWLIDEIRKIDIGTYKHMTVREVKDIMSRPEHDVRIMDSLSDNPADDARFVELNCQNSWGGCFSIMFDTVAYICNDDGKTIERIPVCSEY